MSYMYETRDRNNVDSDSMPRSWKIGSAIGLGLLLLLVFFLMCYRQVDAGKIGIITRGGDVNRTAAPGPMLKLPWPIESFHEMDTRVQSRERDAAAASQDLQDVSATLVLNHHLDSEQALRVFSTIGEEYENRVIDPAMQEVFKATSAQYTAAELITERAAVKAEAVEQLRDRLADYGVIVDDLSLTNFNFSEEFAAAVEATQVAQQQALQAKANAAKVVADAQGRLDEALLDAQKQQALNQTLTAELLQKSWIEKWDGHLPQVTSGDGGTLLQVPLPAVPTE